MVMYGTHVGTRDLVGMRVRSLRLESHETLAQTAVAVGVSESLLSRVENGHRRPTEPLLERLCAHFAVPIEELATAEVTPASHPVRRAEQTSWPGPAVSSDSTGTGALVLADLAISTALTQLRETLGSNDRVERYRSCKTLARLASQPLQSLHDVSVGDSDPMMREAARQLLCTLVEAYVEAKSA